MSLRKARIIWQGFCRQPAVTSVSRRFATPQAPANTRRRPVFFPKNFRESSLPTSSQFRFRRVWMADKEEEPQNCQWRREPELPSTYLQHGKHKYREASHLRRNSRILHHKTSLCSPDQVRRPAVHAVRETNLLSRRSRGWRSVAGFCRFPSGSGAVQVRGHGLVPCVWLRLATTQ